MTCSIVAVGASLGGRAALRVLLQRLPADFPLPIAIAQHRASAEIEVKEAMMHGRRRPRQDLDRR